MNSFFKHLLVTRRRSINGLISQVHYRPRICNQIRRRGLCQSLQNNTDDESWKTFTSSSKEAAAGLLKCSANHVPLSPISFLERAAKVFGDRTSVVYGRSVSYTWSETRRRCLKLASALVHQLEVSPGDVVATLAPYIPAMQELHYAVPMAGAVLCTLNTRHDSAMISVLLQHSQAKVLFVDYHLLRIAQGAIDLITRALKTPPNLVIIHEPENAPSSTSTFDYDRLLANGNDEFDIKWPDTEWDPISLNYTSGTTSQPKGVVYNHRGAYLNAIGTFLIHGMNSFPVYLWTVPMFHCNAWCLVWGLAALGGTNVCLRHVNPKDIFESIALNKVTHMGGAPTVLNMIINSSLHDQKPLPHKVVIMTGGASPPPQTLIKIEELGFSVSHLYGLTETYGPATSCLWKPEWDSSPNDEKYKLKSRQGVQHLCMEDVDVKDSVTMESVAADGKMIGEVMFRGNTVMSGYLKDLEATKDAFRGGWFHTGDLGVKHPDGYIEIKDRQKDIIISGGENISSLEVESVLLRHPAILEAAVVGRPDNHWGQTPCAFVKLKEGFEVKSEEIIEFCRDLLPHYMAPRSIVFEELPRTSTGKVQKFILRERAKALGSLF